MSFLLETLGSFIYFSPNIEGPTVIFVFYYKYTILSFFY